MLISGVNKTGLDFAIALGNANFEGNVKYDYPPKQVSKRTFRLRLKVTDTKGPGALLKRMKPVGSNKACWHAHRDFMRAIFSINPDARIETSLATYNGSDAFETQLTEMGWSTPLSDNSNYRERCKCPDETT